MLLRDLPLEPWGSDDNWQYKLVLLRGKYSLFVCRPTSKSLYRDMGWTLYLQDGKVGGAGLVSSVRNMVAEHNGLDEFEAQAVLDHYLAEYGNAET